MDLDFILEIYTDIEQDHVCFQMQGKIDSTRGQEFKERFKALVQEFDKTGGVINLSHMQTDKD